MTVNAIPSSFDAVRRQVEAELARHFHGSGGRESPVRAAMRESVLSGGKRLRPVMTAIATRDLGCASPAAIRAGCAVELVHTASLLLDDLPCMDDAATRRGRPAVHLRFGEDVAILAAIALLSEAYAMAASLPGVSGEQTARLVTSLSVGIGTKGLVAGQYSDLHNLMSFPDQAAAINDQKTGALFITCLEMAVTLAEADGGTDAALKAYGREIGRAFQLFDDLLDMEGDPLRMGKGVGQDAAKPTLARSSSRDVTLDLIRRHVAEARASLGRLPVEARGLQGLTDHIFGPDEPALRGRMSAAAIMPSLIAR
ncbi:MAG TPA: polyprenyl synthetase family protein [Mesorhizobium sp.]|nr:polyprenyl synthetase family protein [Mesorhizobium sp.]